MGVLAATLLAVGAATAWLLRDPRPGFVKRRSRLATIEERHATRAGGYLTAGIRLHSMRGLAVNLLVRAPDAHPDSVAATPASAAPLRRRAFLILGGYRTGEQAAALAADTRGSVVAALAYPYDGPIDVKGLAVLRHVPAIRRAVMNTPPAVQLAIDYLTSRPDVDTARIELVGASFGAPFATIAAALDTRVSRLWIVHGAGKPYVLLEHNLRRAVPNAPIRALVAGLANVLAAGPRLNPEVWVPQVAPRPVIFINALDDERLPRVAVDALWERAREPRERIWLPGEHVQANRESVVRALLETILTRAARP
jgi:hypothetical protein